MHRILKVGPGGCFAPFLSTKCMNNWIVECHRKISYFCVFPLLTSLATLIICFGCLLVWFMLQYLCYVCEILLWSCVWSYYTLMCACMILSMIFLYDQSCLSLVISACCLYLIILSAPPRCMWHGRVTHDPNRLCICIQKQILNNSQI